MKRLWMALWVPILILGGCPSDADHPNPPAAARTRTSVIAPAHLGKQITVEGRAVNRVGGTVVIGTDFALWIDGLDSWPEGYYLGGDRGRRVSVTGVLAEDHGLPVFIPKEGEPIPQGIPVPEGTDLYKASHRYLLKDATWELVGD